MTASPDKVRRWGPLALSALLHAGLALVGAAVLTAFPPPSAPAPHRDAWAGDTFEIGLVSGRGGSTRAPAPAAAAKPAPAPPARTAPVAKAAPVLAAKAPRARVSAPAPPPHASASAAALPSAPSSHASPAASSRPPGAAPDLSRAMAAAAAGKDSTGARGGRFGAAGVLPGVRDLAKAFTRALPRAASGDPLWSKLPLGPAGGFHVVIRIDDQRRIASAKPDEKTLPPVLQHLLDRTILLLRGGQFALDRSAVTSGSEKLHVELAISMRAPSDQIDVNPSDTVELGFKPPTQSHPGVGYFTLASGRHVEAKVTLEPTP